MADIPPNRRPGRLRSQAARAAGVTALAEGWSGTKWTVEPTPDPSGARFTFLPGVACTSGGNCWAVGEWGSPTGPRTLIEHWNGTAWSITS